MEIFADPNSQLGSSFELKQENTRFEPLEMLDKNILRFLGFIIHPKNYGAFAGLCCLGYFLEVEVDCILVLIAASDF